MKRAVLLYALGAALVLSGCKTEIDAPVNYSELFGPQKSITGWLSVEVPACKDATNKQFESSSVMEAKQKIPYIFPEAKYLQCKDEGFDSYASFNIPIHVGGKEADCKKNQICAFPNDSGSWVDVKIGDEVIKKTKDVSKTDFNGNDVRISLTITNDTGKTLHLYVPSAFVAGIPVYMSTVEANDDVKNMSIQLDNVATSVVIKGKPVSVFADKDKE